MTRLDEIAARVDAATPGPWERGITTDGTRRVATILDGSTSGVEIEDIHTPYDPIATSETAANADLIAHAPEDIAALLDIVRAAQSVVGEYHPGCPALIAELCDALAALETP
jgi:hypothetical protein